MPERLTEADFVSEFERIGPRGMERKYKLNYRSLLQRRSRIEDKTGRQLVAPQTHGNGTRVGAAHPQRVQLDVESGVVLVGSDGHYWPGAPSAAHRAFVKFYKKLKPRVVIMNGDAFDGARISRHPPIGWENRPEVIQELEAVQERLGEIEDAAPSKAKLVWPLGNHDGRFETRLATVASDYARIHGFHLKDHVGQRWQPCWAAWINNEVVVKHRYKGGIHGSHNETLYAGKTTVTGHDHQLKVSPLPDYNGIRWGVKCGCLSDPFGPQFTDYTEDNPRMWQAGFIVLTFHKGVLLTPEMVRVHSPDHVDFRGQLIRV